MTNLKKTRRTAAVASGSIVGATLLAALFSNAPQICNDFNVFNADDALNGAKIFATETEILSNEPKIKTKNELENDFFDVLWRCDSPLLVERNAAEDELTRRFIEFEPIWQNREFLTNGEISPEAAWRFGLAEARSRADVERRTLDAFRTFCDVGPRSDGAGASENSDNAEKHGAENATRPLRVRIDWPETARIVYLSPDWRAFFWRDPDDGSVWRPRERFSAPEILPEFGATSLEIAATLERVDDETTANSLNSDDSASETSENGAFDALIGADLRDFNVALNVSSNDISTSAAFRSGDLTLDRVETRRRENGETTVFLRLEYENAFDAFDSHRVWFDFNDFAIAISSPNQENASKIFAPLRFRTRARNVRGVSLELDFPATATDALENAAPNGGAAVLRCRVPRFFLPIRVPFR